MGQLKNVVRLSETDYSTLLNGGSVTKGGKTYTLDANTLYVVEDETPPSYAQRSDYASEAGWAHGADCASHDADGNNIVETYATKDDVDAELSGKANKNATVSTVVYDTTNKKLTKTINGTTSDVVTASTVVTDGGGYKKPSTGIPKTDLASAVQTSLGKADTALQSHQDISGKANLASPTFTGTPKAPTAAAGTNTTQIATTAFVQSAVGGKSKVTVNQPTSGSGTGTQVTVDGTTYQVVADTDPGTTNGIDYKMAPTWHQVRTQLAAKADKSATVSTVGYDTTNKKLTKTINGTTSDVVTASTIVTDGGGYKKPAAGIPKTDLASAVQTSLGKADTALQSHQDISGKADKEDFGFADGTAHTHANDKTLGIALKIYNPTLGSGQTADVVNSSTISGEATEDSADAKTHIPTWQGIMKWVKSLGYATVSATNTALAGKSKVTVNQPTSGSGTGTQLTVDGTTYQVVIDTDPGTDNGYDYRVAPTWHQMKTQLAAKADKSATVSTVGYDATNKKLTKTINGTTSDVVTASTIVTDGGGYKKPAAGIPKTDLASAVQTSLDKADTALQSHQDISGKANLASPTFTGTPKAPTAASGTNTTQIATTAFVQNAVEAKSMMITAAENAYSDTAGQRVIPFSSPSGMAGIYGAILQWTAQPNRLPSDGNPSWYFQLLARHNGELYFRSRINGENWSSFRLLAFRRDLDDYAKTSDLPGDASTSQKGLVQLSGTISTDNAKAATPAAVNDALTSFAQQVQARINEAVAGKSKVEVSQSSDGTLVKVDGTDYMVVSETEPTDNAHQWIAPSWDAMISALNGKVDNSVAGANSLFSNMPTGTATPTDTTYLILQPTSGEASFWRVPFSAVWDYIVRKASDEVDEGDNAAIPSSQAIAEYIGNICMKTASTNTHDNTAGQRVIPFSSPDGMAGIYGAILQWTAQPYRLPSDGNPSWYFQLLARSNGELYFRSRINGENWSSFRLLAFRRDLNDYAKTSDLPGDASTSQKGIVQLSGTINSDNAKAATPAAVYDALTSFAQQAQSRINEAVAGKSAVEVSQSSDGTMLTVDDTDYTLVSEQEPTGNANQMIAPSWDAMKSAMNAKANLASPTFTGTPKAPTAAAGTNTTQIATTAFVQTAVNKRLAQYHFGYPENSDNAQRWKKIGSYTTGGDGSAFVIEIFGGNGYNANWYQNTAVRIMIKDGHQTTKAAAESVGITVEKFITDNVDYEVAVVASSDTQGDVWLKVNTTYTRYEYMVYGNFASWTHNSSFAAADFTTTAPAHNQKAVEYIDYLKGLAITTWVSRNNFTEAQWATYAATAHEEGWAATLKHGLKKGDYFAVTGQATDTKNYHTAIYRCDEPGGSGVNPHGKCIRHYNASAPEDAFGLTFRLALNTHVFQSGVTDTGNNFISIVALTRNSAGVETLYTTGTIVVKDATGTVRSTWTNKCYATFSGSGFTTFANYSGPFTVELQNASGTVLTSTQIVKV